MKGMHLSLREKIGQMFMVGFYGTEPDEQVRDFIRDYHPGFVILFARNIRSIPQVIELTNSLHSRAVISPFLYVDQEGGTVVQFREMAATVISHMGLAATGRPENAREASRILGGELNACGFDGILAPVLDVNYQENNPIIGIRSFSDDPETVIRYASQFYQGLRESGLAGCGKHFPGHGGTLEDSHLAIPRVDISPEDFDRLCLQPFKVLAGRQIDAMITSHVMFPEIDSELTTFSVKLIQGILRGEWGFQGLVISDCLEMQAIKDKFSAEEIVTRGIRAGVDVFTVSHHLDFQKELADILYFKIKKGRIEEKRLDRSLSRILALKNRYGLLQTRKIRDPESDGKAVRSHLEQEKKLAGQSITLVRDEQGLIPLRRNRRVLILEWQKVKATQPLSQAEDRSMLEEMASRYFRQVEIRLLKLDGQVPEDFLARLSGFEYVIAGLYSRNPDIAILQSRALNCIRKYRGDVIAVALGNPYDISYLPGIQTYLATYGFRRIQIEALFKVLIGEIMASGTLPVHIHGIAQIRSGKKKAGNPY
jgi:beta-N-acetylhexosaminidase